MIPIRLGISLMGNGFVNLNRDINFEAVYPKIPVVRRRTIMKTICFVISFDVNSFGAFKAYNIKHLERIYPIIQATVYLSFSK